MQNFTLYHTNAIETAVLGGGAWQPNLPLANLFTPTTTKRARSVNTQLTSTQLTAKLADNIQSLGIQVISTNLSAAAQYKISWYSDPEMTLLNGTTGFIAVGTSIDWTVTAQWFDWLAPNFWLGAIPFVDPDNLGRDIRHTFADFTAVQYLKLEFDDVTNADGFVEIGYLYIGRAYVPSINVDTTPIFNRVSLTSMAEAVGGAQFFNRRGSRKRLTVTWAVLPLEEVLVELDEIIRIQDIDKPVYVDLQPDNLTSGRTTSFLARMEKLPESRLLQVYLDDDTAAAVGFEFIQVL